MVFLTFFATIITAPSTKKAPRLAANARPKLENAILATLPEKIETPKTNRATPKLAPELIPNTNGPANGFLNKVCINKPQIDNPEPTNTAVMALGSLDCNMIYCQDSLVTSFPVKVCKIDLRGMSTEPKLRFMRMKSINNNAKRINFNVYLEWALKDQFNFSKKNGSYAVNNFGCVIFIISFNTIWGCVGASS